MMLIDMGREQDVTLNDNECWNQKDFSEFASTLVFRGEYSRGTPVTCEFRTDTSGT